MSDYISREALIGKVEKHYCAPCKGQGGDLDGNWCRSCVINSVLEKVRGIPAAAVIEDYLSMPAAFREQREGFMPPCYQPDGDGCAYQIYGPDDDEPIERCKACPLCYSDKARHHKPKTPCDLCLYNPPSSGDEKPCTMCPASSLPEPPKEDA